MLTVIWKIIAKLKLPFLQGGNTPCLCVQRVQVYSFLWPDLTSVLCLVCLKSQPVSVTRRIYNSENKLFIKAIALHIIFLLFDRPLSTSQQKMFYLFNLWNRIIIKSISVLLNFKWKVKNKNYFLTQLGVLISLFITNT